MRGMNVFVRPLFLLEQLHKMLTLLILDRADNRPGRSGKHAVVEGRTQLTAMEDHAAVGPVGVSVHELQKIQPAFCLRSDVLDFLAARRGVR